ncbi:YcxB family protein [Pseudoalteromonas distincta]|uniref:YcxB family protein n=1 Tax=Pseudoalteromonas distincta TaxID=77608 RepID=UPI00165FC219|nr:YcxB family protein [Pseudoalteromonas distincta]MBD0411909.1 YcxB family protein [Pseudoalteromonas distincta]
MIKSITVTKKNYTDYADFIIKKLCAPKDNKGLGFIKNMIVWFVLAVVIMTFFQVESIRLSDFHWPSGLIVAVPFLILIIVFLYNNHKLKEQSIPNENGVMIGDKTIEFQADGIRETNHLGSYFYKWQAVEAMEENKGDLYIFVDKLLALIIPASTFTNEAEKEELKAFIKAHI